MSLLIPEIPIIEVTEMLMKKVHDELVTGESVGTVSANPSTNSSAFSLAFITTASLGVPQVFQLIVKEPTLLSEFDYVQFSTPSRDFIMVFVNGITNAKKITAKEIDENRQTIIFNYEGIALGTRDPLANAIVSYLQTYYYNWFTDFTITSSGGFGAYKNISIENVESNGGRNSLLYQMFGTQKQGKMDFFSQVGGILKRKFGKGNSRVLDIKTGFHINKTDLPNISVLLPNEEPKYEQAGLTQGQPCNFYVGGKRANIASEHYQTQYTLLITSDNENEVVALYHFLKGLMLAGRNQYQFRGLEGIRVTGRDLSMDFDLAPTQLYHRGVGLSFHYDNNIASIEYLTETLSATFVGTQLDLPKTGSAE